MQLIVALILAAAALAASQIYLALRFAAALSKPAPPDVDDDRLPRAAVILCLRGPDPFLARTLSSMLAQDYPRHELRIIIDSAGDPAAAQVAERIPASTPNVCISHLRAPGHHGSLKCQALCQVLGELSADVEVIALVDADVAPHARWLRELVAPLARDPGVGVTTGNRWYMPPDARVGSLVRYIWNACAVPQMHAYRIPWGGSVALRMELFRHTNLAERWSAALSEDTMLRTAAHDCGLRVEPVAEVLMVNRESCTLRQFHAWVARQLLVARLYHRSWPLVVAHGVLTAVLPLALLMAAGWTAAQGNWPAAMCAATGCVGFFVVMLPMLPWMERAARRVVRRRGEPAAWLSLGKFLAFIVAIPALAVVYPAALLRACTARRIDWRGVEYEIAGPRDVRLIEYRPWTSSSGAGLHESL